MFCVVVVAIAIVIEALRVSSCAHGSIDCSLLCVTVCALQENLTNPDSNPYLKFGGILVAGIVGGIVCKMVWDRLS